MELPFEVNDAILDPDRPVVYMTSSPDGKFYALNVATGLLSEMDATGVIGTQPDALALGRGRYDGELYVAVHDVSPYPGWVAVVDRSTFVVADKIALDVNPYEVLAGRDGYLYIVSTPSGSNAFLSYNRATKRMKDRTGMYAACYLDLHPAMERIYGVEVGVSPRQFRAYNIASGTFTDPDYPGGYDYPYFSEYDLRPSFGIDPAGRYLVNGSGDIFACAADRAQDILYVASLTGEFNNFNGIAFEPDFQRFYTASDWTDTVNVYQGSDFSLVGTYALHDSSGEFLFKRDSQLIVFLRPSVTRPTCRAEVQILDLPNRAPLLVGSNPPSGGTVTDLT